MGATKIEHYPKETINLAKLANALGHPARITIVKTLMNQQYSRNVEFQTLLNLSQTAVHNHLVKLRLAEIVEFQYCVHEYHVKLVQENLEDLYYFIKT